MTSWELFQSFKNLYYLDSINPFTQKKQITIMRYDKSLTFTCANFHILQLEF